MKARSRLLAPASLNVVGRSIAWPFAMPLDLAATAGSAVWPCAGTTTDRQIVKMLNAMGLDIMLVMGFTAVGYRRHGGSIALRHTCLAAAGRPDSPSRFPQASSCCP